MPDAGQIHGPRRTLIDDAAVFHRAIAPATLDTAWTRVLTNGGAAGGDGIGLRQFQANAPLRLARLRDSLINGGYTPSAIRRVDIPKTHGGVRTLGIPSVIDRVAQTAVLLILGPLLDEEFEDSSFAYRAGRSVQAAVERVRALRAGGQVFLVDADVDGFFDAVPHDRLMVRLGETMTDGPTSQLIGLWLEHAGSNGRGLAQGSPISPVLANLYLDRLDEAFAGAEARIVRFADDFVILTASRADADAALRKVARLLEGQGLRLNADKTRVTSFDQGFHFLGHLFVRSMVMAGQGRDEADAVPALMRQLAARDAQADDRARTDAEREALERSHGLDPGQRVLYVASADRRLALRNQGFSVQAGTSEGGGHVVWREILALPHAAVDRIELGPTASATMEALRQGLATDTPIAFVNGHGETQGWLAPRFGPRAARHLAQARHVLDEALRLALARRFVEARIRNHRALLRRLNRERQVPELIKPLAELNRMIRGIDVPVTLSELLGHEEHAAAVFWPAFGRLLDGGVTFRTREREGAGDPVNILLNVTAHLLTRDAAVALERAGLHAGFGLLHGTGDYADGAVYDLMEEFRAPLSESVVAQAVNTRAMSEADFEPRGDGGVRLRSTGYASMIRVYERAVAREVASRRDGKRRTWRGIMLDQALSLAAHVEGRGDYRPYVLDY